MKQSTTTCGFKSNSIGPTGNRVNRRIATIAHITLVRCVYGRGVHQNIAEKIPSLFCPQNLEWKPWIILLNLQFWRSCDRSSYLKTLELFFPWSEWWENLQNLNPPNTFELFWKTKWTLIQSKNMSSSLWDIMKICRRIFLSSASCCPSLGHDKLAIVTTVFWFSKLFCTHCFCTPSKIYVPIKYVAILCSKQTS